ncbi:TPA: chorismate mutase [Klebsiella pneumoniae]
MNFSCIEDVRKRIDEIDSQLVRIIAQRSECVKAAAAFKTDHAAYFHERRSLNNFHRDRVITFEQIAE